MQLTAELVIRLTSYQPYEERANAVVRVSLTAIIGTIGTDCNRFCCHDLQRFADQWAMHARLLIWLLCSGVICCQRKLEGSAELLHLHAHV